MKTFNQFVVEDVLLEFDAYELPKNWDGDTTELRRRIKQYKSRTGKDMSQKEFNKYVKELGKQNKSKWQNLINKRNEPGSDTRGFAHGRRDATDPSQGGYPRVDDSLDSKKLKNQKLGDTTKGGEVKTSKPNVSRSYQDKGITHKSSRPQTKVSRLRNPFSKFYTGIDKATGIPVSRPPKTGKLPKAERDLIASGGARRAKRAQKGAETLADIKRGIDARSPRVQSTITRTRPRGGSLTGPIGVQSLAKISNAQKIKSLVPSPGGKLTGPTIKPEVKANWQQATRGSGVSSPSLDSVRQNYNQTQTRLKDLKTSAKGNKTFSAFRSSAKTGAKTGLLRKVGRFGLSKGVPLVYAGLDTYGTYKKEKEKGSSTGRALAKGATVGGAGAAGFAGGAWAGAKGGAALGGAIGSIVPGAGTAIGAGIGGVIGSLVGGTTGHWLASKGASKGFEKIAGPNKGELAKKEREETKKKLELAKQQKAIQQQQNNNNNIGGGVGGNSNSKGKGGVVLGTGSKRLV